MLSSTVNMFKKEDVITRIMDAVNERNGSVALALFEAYENCERVVTNWSGIFMFAPCIDNN